MSSAARPGSSANDAEPAVDARMSSVNAVFTLSLILTRSGTLVNTTVISPDWSCAVSCRLDTSLPVMFPESFVISARGADRDVTVMSPEWPLIVVRPEIRVALMSPESVLSVTVPGVSLTADTAILATLQDRVAGLYLHAVETDAAQSSFTIFLSKASGREVRIGWFALG